MPSASELRERFRAALRTELEADGWTELEFDGHLYIIELAHPIDEEFIAIAGVGQAVVPPLEITDVDAALCYLPLRRLWPQLGEPWNEPRVIRRLRCAGDDDPWPIGSDEDAGAVAQRVAALVREQALGFATEHASVAAMLESFAAQDGPDGYRELALLAAAGRLDEARDGLARFNPEDGFPAEADRGGERFARQLRRFIDSAGAPQPRTETSASSLGAVWSTARDRHYAVQAVQRVASGRTRDELRELLEAELAKRELSASPIWIEQTLDTLSLSPSQQWQRTGELLSRIGAGLAHTLQAGKLPDLSVPEWLAPPPRAAYAVPRSPNSPRAAVMLDPDARDWLDDVHDALPKLLDEPIELSAWLDATASGLAVHIGQRRVGTLDDAATAAFVPVIRAAADRDELPRTTARIRRRPDGSYLLELQLP